MKERKIVFICTPNLGILDNWLPVLYNLKKGEQIILLFLLRLSQAQSMKLTKQIYCLDFQRISLIVLFFAHGLVTGYRQSVLWKLSN